MIIFSQPNILISAFTLLSLALALPASENESIKPPGSYSLSLRRGQTSASSPVSYVGYAGRWYTNFTIGGQELTLEVDTGSADLWVYGPKVGTPGVHNAYDPTKSSTSIARERFSITYMTGKGVSGYVVQDTVAFGSVSVSDFALGVATEVDDADYPDGMIGMGFQSDFHPNKSYPTFIEAAKSSLDLPVFTIDFGDTANAVMTLGAIDESKYSGKLTTAQASQCDSAWCLNDVTFTVNGVPMNFTQKKMSVDTGGGPYMIVDPFVAQTYYAQVPGSWNNGAKSPHWAVPCNATLPDLTLNIGNGSAVIPGRVLLSNKPIANSPDCSGNLQGGKGQIGGGNLADPFFLSQFVVFHIDDRTISFAEFA